MGEIAVRAARAAGYVNAGTIEFLLEKSGALLLYGNEYQDSGGTSRSRSGSHGIDLIKEQICIASGRMLCLISRKILRFSGHAIEIRINAEKPEEGFRPCPGTITGLHLPGGKGVRIDSAIYSGYADSAFLRFHDRENQRLGPDPGRGHPKNRRAPWERSSSKAWTPM